MRILCVAAVASIVASGTCEARTVARGDEAAYALFALIACAHQAQLVGSAAVSGDLSRSPGQLRRLARLEAMTAARSRVQERSAPSTVMVKLAVDYARPGLIHRRTT